MLNRGIGKVIPAAPVVCPGHVSGPGVPSDIWTCLSTYPELGFLPGSAYPHLEFQRSEAVPRQLKPVWVPRGLVVAALLKSWQWWAMARTELFYTTYPKA